MNDFITTLVTTALVFAVILAVFFIIYGSIRWVTSRGDKEAAANAQKTITAAIIGLIIALSAWAILNFIGALFSLPKWTRTGGLGGSSGSGRSGGSGGSSGTATCDTVCKSVSPCTPGNPEGFCSSDCRCICSGSTAISLPDPWCDRTGDTYTCKGGRTMVKPGC